MKRPVEGVGGRGRTTPPDSSHRLGWYVWFVQHIAIPWAGFFTYLVTFGEILVGLFMNLNFMMAGAISINPIIGGVALFLILAWRVAGYYGGDRWVLPLLGTPGRAR